MKKFLIFLFVCAFIVSCNNKTHTYTFSILEMSYNTFTGEISKTEIDLPYDERYIYASNDSLAYLQAYQLYGQKVTSAFSSNDSNHIICDFFVVDENSNLLTSYYFQNTDIQAKQYSIIKRLEQSAANAKAFNDNLYKKVKKWRIDEEIDEMTDSKNIWKTIDSDNIEYFDFPYNKGSYLSIVVRYMKKFGTDVLLKINSGQIQCNQYNGTNYVNIRFDDDSPVKFYTNESSSGRSNTVFLKNPSKFINRAKNANMIKIEIPIFQEGLVLFKFTIEEPLVWEL